MDLLLTNRGGEISADIEQRLEKKRKKLERLSKGSSELHVVVVHERTERRVEASMHAYGQEIFAEERGEDLAVCAEGALEKLVAQVKKRKDRVTDHSPRP